MKLVNDVWRRIYEALIDNGECYRQIRDVRLWQSHLSVSFAHDACESFLQDS
jgi:hypothetical protein